MDKFKVQCLDQACGNCLTEKDINNDQNNRFTEIIEILRQFQAGYTSRDLKKVNTFMEELFLKGEEMYAMGTGMGEMYFGSEEVKELIKGDWEEWGDVNIDCENAHISVKGEVAWFATKGSVKYSFEDSPESYESHLNFIRSNIEDPGLTSKQKIAVINWALALICHQREGNKREYFWPMNLSGVLLKDAGKWKFAHLKFSMTRSNFPDERFENSKEFLENYNKFTTVASKYKNNKVSEELKRFLKSLEIEFIAQEGVSEELVSKYFTHQSTPYIIGLDNQWYNGIEQVREFFDRNNDSTISLDFDNAIVSKSGEVNWVTITGKLRQDLTESELAERITDEINNLFQSNLTSKEKLFLAHRSVSCALKESASGTSYTWPIRLTAVILNRGTDFVFHNIHFSFPFYWIIEGKVDGVL